MKRTNNDEKEDTCDTVGGREETGMEWKANIRVYEKNLLNFSSSPLLANNIIDSGITFQSTMFTLPFPISSSSGGGHSLRSVHTEPFVCRTLTLQ